MVKKNGLRLSDWTFACATYGAIKFAFDTDPTFIPASLPGLQVGDQSSDRLVQWGALREQLPK